MEEDGLVEQLQRLFQDAVNQHGIAYPKSGAPDEEWPLWYAEHLIVDLGKALNATFSKSELVYLLVLAERQRLLESPGSEWTRYYAQFFAKRYD